MKLILDMCGGTGSWSKPYADAGYTVLNITLPNWDVRLYPSRPSDIKRSSIDYRKIINHRKVQGILAAPPCTVFATSGNHCDRSDQEILDGLSVIDSIIRLVWVLKPQWWCLENPQGKLTRWLGEPVMYVQPWEFGDPYTKRTALWGDFNNNFNWKLVAPTEGSKMIKGVRCPEERSITPPGFAQAFFEANP